MLERYSLKLPKAVYSGHDALSNLSSIIRAEGCERVALITDKGIESTGLDKLVLQKIDESGVECVVFDDIPPEPEYAAVQRVADDFRSSRSSLIIALGGGSVMDTAKLVSILMGNYTIKDLLETPSIGKKSISSVMIPTTAGTGSEATPNAIVAVPEDEVKVGIVNDSMIADYVILDHEMIRNLPRKIGAATGIDALAHAIECFTGNKANPFSDTFALKALDLILNNIEKACDDSDALDAKTNMQIAAFYAGIAITSSGTTAVHALSYPLGGKFHIAHGVSNAILLAPVMRFNMSYCKDRLGIVYDTCFHHRDFNLSIDGKAEAVIKRLEQIVHHLDIPQSLRTFGIKDEDIETLAISAMGVQRLLANNPRHVSLEDARFLYLSLM